MKLAILILCHKNPKQINMLIDSLEHPDIDIFIHIDKKKLSMKEKIKTKPRVYFIPNDSLVEVRWGTFSQVEAHLALLSFSFSKKYDYYWLISGQCYPLVTPNTIIDFLKSTPSANYVDLVPSKNYKGIGKQTNLDKRNHIIFPEWMFKQALVYRIIRRLWVEITGGYYHTFGLFLRKDSTKYDFYYDSSWYCISQDFANYFLELIRTNSDFLNCFRLSSCPDESFMQTALMNSKFKNSRKEYLHYVDWSEGKNSPKFLSAHDLDKAFKSHKLMARKIDLDHDSMIINEIERMKKTSKN